jgi:NitT/TauT family transport system ATP-binding protein
MIFPRVDGELVALKDVDLEIKEGEFVSLIGPSGCGKSTLLRLIADICQPTTGSVTVAGLSPFEARRRHLVNLMFQEPVLLPWLSILKNILLAVELAKPDEHLSASELLDLVGLQGRGKDYPHQLSGGMQQRVALARALATNPRILLMDEPFGALDEFTRDKMGSWLLSIWERARKTVLFVTHSIPEALFLSDRVVVMDTGPGRILVNMNVELPRPRTEEMQEGIEFFEQLSHLRGYLREAGLSLQQSGNNGDAAACL